MKPETNEKGKANSQPKTPPPAPVKEPKPKKAPKQKPEPVRLPVMVEMIFDFAGILLVLVDAMVFWISWSSGATWTDILVRIAITTVILGSVLWFFSKMLASGALEAAKRYQEEEKKKQEEQTQVENSLMREA